MRLRKWVIPFFSAIGIVFFVRIVGLEEIQKVFYGYSHPIRYESIVNKYSQKYSVDRALIYAVMKNESKFYPFAKSIADSKGLMQISEITFTHAKNVADISGDDIYNKETNIEVGVWYLSYLLSRFQNEEYAILAYNAGPENINAWLDRGFLDINSDYSTWNIPYIETRMYIERVINSKEYYSKKIANNKGWSDKD